MTIVICSLLTCLKIEHILGMSMRGESFKDLRKRTYQAEFKSSFVGVYQRQRLGCLSPDMRPQGSFSFHEADLVGARHTNTGPNTSTLEVPMSTEEFNPTQSLWQVNRTDRVVFQGDHNSVDDPAIKAGDTITARVAFKSLDANGKPITLIRFTFNGLTGYIPSADAQTIKVTL